MDVLGREEEDDSSKPQNAATEEEALHETKQSGWELEVDNDVLQHVQQVFLQEGIQHQAN